MMTPCLETHQEMPIITKDISINLEIGSFMSGTRANGQILEQKNLPEPMLFKGS